MQTTKVIIYNVLESEIGHGRKIAATHNSEDDFVFHDGSDDSHQWDDKEGGADGNEHDGSDAQQPRVGCVRPHLIDCNDVWVHQHPGANADQRQPAQLTKINTPAA